MAVQGTSYLAFAAWALVAPAHYRRVHELNAEPWLLRSHALWLSLVGATLAAGAQRDRADAPQALLGLGAAAGLALNDAYSDATGELADIYRRDLLFELTLLAGWLAVLADSGRVR